MRTARIIAGLAAASTALVVAPTAAHAADSLAASSVSIGLPAAGAGFPELALSRDGRTAFVTANGPHKGSVTAIDLSSGSVRASVAMDNPVSPVIATDGRVIVSGPKPAALNPNSLKVLASASGLKSPSAVAVGPLGKRLFLVDDYAGELVSLDAKTLRTVKRTKLCPRNFADVGPGAEQDGPTDSAASTTPDGKTVVVTCLQDGMQLIDAKSGKRIAGLQKAWGEGPVVFNADGSRGYLAADTDVVSVDLNARTVLKRASAYLPGDGRKGGVIGPWKPVLSADDKTLFIPWATNGVLKAVDTTTLQATSIPLDGKTQWDVIGAALSQDGTRLYVLTYTDVVTIDPTSYVVLGIDRAVPEGANANAIATSGSQVIVTWSSSQGAAAKPSAGVNLLAMK